MKRYFSATDRFFIAQLFFIALIIFVSACVRQQESRQARETQIQETGLRKLDNLTYGLPEETFSQLPPFPEFKSFMNVKDRVEHQMHNLGSIPEAYYKQPEFYPTFLENIELMKTPPSGRAALMGFGAYPAEQAVKSRKGETITVTTFFHASWIVPRRQEISLTADYDKRYFDVSIDPSIFVLGPSYPAFDYNWTRKVDVKITARATGHYVIGLNAPSFVVLSEPYFRLNIDVVD